MKIGLIARADNSGLGIQTWEFYKHMHPYRTMVVDIGGINGNKQYYERYPEPDATFVKGFPSNTDIDLFLTGLDVVFVAESPYNFYLYERARELGVKTAVQYNYEFFDWFVNPNYPKPDMLIAPSKWHYGDIQKWCGHYDVKHIYLHCPVNRELLPFREITKARKFLHVAGKAAAHDRNGTETVIEAAKYLKTDAQIEIHFQGEQGLPHQATKSIADYVILAGDKNHNLVINQTEYPDYQDVYREGDVMLLPRRYGGNCLPMNEALSVGMPVIMTDISPNSSFLPTSWLIPATQVGQFTPRTTVDIYGAEPEELADKIDVFYNLDSTDMLDLNRKAKLLARSISWDSMKSQYQAALEGLCNQS